jgi:N-hydroxyarylamine O-acetyltransferase
MTEEESVLADFDPHHRRLATDPESSFVKTFVVQSPRPDRIVTLRSRTLSVVGPGETSKRVLERDEFAPTLEGEFGVVVDGERLERLWERAVAQHEAFLARA